MSTNNHHQQEPALKILGISGSLRAKSFNTALLRTAVDLAPSNINLTIFDIRDVPFYNGDVEAQGDPGAVRKLKEAIHDADGVLFSTPEYNWSVPGVLKNTIDWASRDKRPRSLTGKPVTIMGTGGITGTARAQSHLQHILTEAGAHVLMKPGVLVTLARQKFDADGHLTDEMTGKFLAAHLVAFGRWVERLRQPAREPALAATTT